jgi:hypothetical protein
LVFPATGFLVIAYVFYEMDTMAKVLGACWLAIGVIDYTLLTFFPEKAGRTGNPGLADPQSSI